MKIFKWIVILTFLFSVTTFCSNTLTFNKNDYEILCKDSYYDEYADYHIYVDTAKIHNLKEADLFIKYIRKQLGETCEIWLYDSKESLPFILSQEKEAKEYVILADYCLALSKATSPDSTTWYPLQNEVYKESGGQNWKK